MRRERPQRNVEAHWLARVRQPVAGLHVRACGKHFAGQPGDQREAEGAHRYAPQRALEVGQHRFHERRVEGVRDVQGARRDAVRREPAQHRAHRLALAGDDRVRRAVDGGDGDLPAVRFERGGDPLRAGEDGSHLARRRERLHQARALGDEPKPLFERERAREARRRVLADAVPEDEVRLDAPRPPQLGERVFEREERGLRVSRLVEQRRRLRLPVEHREQRPFESWAQDFVAALQRAAKAWLRLVKLAPHPVVLRALPGEEEGRLRVATGGRVRVTQAIGPLAAGEGVQG